MHLSEALFVYRHLPIDEKMNLPLCVLSDSVVALILKGINLLRKVQ